MFSVLLWDILLKNESLFSKLPRYEKGFFGILCFQLTPGMARIQGTDFSIG